MKKKCVRFGPRQYFLLLAATILAVQVLFLPLPKPIIRLIAEHGAAWMLNDTGAAPSGLEAALQKLVGETLQQSLIAHLHSVGPEHKKGRDVDFAARQLQRLRPMLINQSELYHNPAKGPMALSGLAWCDMANGLAGRLLAHDFERIQIVGVRGSKIGFGHSFGRFWSRQYSGWLYFDIWPEEVFIFRVIEGGGIEYLHRSLPLTRAVDWPGDIATARKFHALVGQGFIHNELQSNIGSYFFHRIINFFMYGRSGQYQAIISPSKVVQQSAFSFERQAPDTESPAINIYASARVEHFFGNHDQAAVLYRETIRLDRGKSVFGSAAYIFASRLNRSEHPSTKLRPQ